MDIDKVLNEATKEIEESSNQLDLQNVKVAYLGKKGKITAHIGFTASVADTNSTICFGLEIKLRVII